MKAVPTEQVVKSTCALDVQLFKEGGTINETSRRS